MIFATIKTFLGSLLAINSAILVSASLSTAQPQPFKCGSDTLTFVGRTKTTWFGTGEWEGATYSHLGTRSSAGYGASDLCEGNFGNICNNFDYGSLNFKQVYPRGFDVTSAWSEKWR
jgi:hypothetical protein